MDDAKGDLDIERRNGMTEYLNFLDGKAKMLKHSLAKINCANFPIRRFRVRFLRIGSRRPVDPRNSLAFIAEHSHPRFGAAQNAFEVFHSVLRPASEDIRTH